MCKDCGKTFYAVKASLSSNMCQDINRWIIFVKGMLRQHSLDELSEECNISRKTAHRWRLRVFSALETLLADVKLSGIIIADDTRLNYNLKGNHGEDFFMPRSSRARGKCNTIHNYNKNSMCVLCAIDENGNAFSRVIGFGVPSAARICEGFKGKVNVEHKNNVLVTDGAQYFSKAIKTYKFLSWKKKATRLVGKKRLSDTIGAYNIQQINAYHSRLKSFVRKHNGISSRYLPGYLLLFDFIQNNKGVDESALCKRILYALATSDPKTGREIELKYVVPVSNIPNQEMWETKVPLEEQSIYKDWFFRVAIKEICRKHKVTRRRIYTIKEKVEKYRLHDVIINKKITTRKKPSEGRPISERDWGIFIDVYNRGVPVKELAAKYSVSLQAIYKVVNKIKIRPEAQGVEPFAKPKKPKKPKMSEAEWHELGRAMYLEYKILRTANYPRQSIYKILAEKYTLLPSRVEYVILPFRKAAPFPDVKKMPKKERIALPKVEYYQLLQNRNSKLLHDIDILQKENPQMSLSRVFSTIAPKYNLSRNHVRAIFRNPQKYLHIYDNYIVKLQAQARARERGHL